MVLGALGLCRLDLLRNRNAVRLQVSWQTTYLSVRKTTVHLISGRLIDHLLGRDKVGLGFLSD